MPLNGTLATEQPAPAGSRLTRPRRSLLARLSTGRALMILSGLLTFVLVVAATDNSDARMAVAVAAQDIPAGAAITAELLRRVEVPADSALTRTTVRWDRLPGGGRVARQPIAAGELLRPSDVIAPSADGRAGLRAMSIPVKPERAVGGTLRVGDRVDVIDVVHGTPSWIVTSAQVIAVPAERTSRGIVRDVGAVYHVVVEVNAKEALALAEALTHDTVSVVRSTGAPPLPARPTTTAPPPEAASSADPPVPTADPTTPAPAAGS